MQYAAADHPFAAASFRGVEIIKRIPNPALALSFDEAVVGDKLLAQVYISINEDRS